MSASLVVWVSAVVFGAVYLYRYETTPGTDGDGAPRADIFPAGSRVRLDAGRPTLLVFAHPHCPCTRATVRELSKLMTEARGRLAVRVLFVTPPDFPADWAETDLWRSAAAVPGVEVALDDGGREAALFAAETSGATLLYDAGGKLLFRGGITRSRGQEGDSAGRRSVLDFVTRRESETDSTLVFGCALKNSRDRPQENKENQ